MSLFFIIAAILGTLLIINFLLFTFSCNKEEKEKHPEVKEQYHTADK